MKIGILTFHWATNYGAILQAYCLQEWLRECGHEVKILNYKPHQFDFSWAGVLFNLRKLRRLPTLLAEKNKEALLVPFRDKHLKMTQRFYKTAEMAAHVGDFDMLISGSDQVLNAYFTTHGEDETPSAAYYLSFAEGEAKRIGYAISFGCETYPDYARPLAAKQINCFDAVAVRERTGLSVLDELEYKGKKCIVPDPTILYGKKLFERLNVTIPTEKQDYTCVYMLRREIKIAGKVKYMDERHTPLAMEGWLSNIANAGQIITNSYHGMIMAILSHVPFVALLEKGLEGGMNDRFATLLERLGLEDRMVNQVGEVERVLALPIDFDKVDKAIEDYRKLGVVFLVTETA